MMKALPHRAGSVREAVFAVCIVPTKAYSLDVSALASFRDGMAFASVSWARADTSELICIDSAGVEAQE